MAPSGSGYQPGAYAATRTAGAAPPTPRAPAPLPKVSGYQPGSYAAGARQTGGPSLSMLAGQVKSPVSTGGGGGGWFDNLVSSPLRTVAALGPGLAHLGVQAAKTAGHVGWELGTAPVTIGRVATGHEDPSALLHIAAAANLPYQIASAVAPSISEVTGKDLPGFTQAHETLAQVAPVSSEFAQSASRTAGRVTHPSRYGEAWSQGQIFPAALEDVANLSMLASAGAGALSAPTRALPVVAAPGEVAPEALAAEGLGARGALGPAVPPALTGLAPGSRLASIAHDVASLGEKTAGGVAKPWEFALKEGGGRVVKALSGGRTMGQVIEDAAKSFYEERDPNAPRPSALTRSIYRQLARVSPQGRQFSEIVGRGAQNEYDALRQAAEASNVARKIGAKPEEMDAAVLIADQRFAPLRGLYAEADPQVWTRTIHDVLDSFPEYQRSDPGTVKLAMEADAIRNGHPLPTTIGGPTTEQMDRITQVLDSIGNVSDRQRQAAMNAEGWVGDTRGLNPEQLGTEPLSAAGEKLRTPLEAKREPLITKWGRDTERATRDRRIADAHTAAFAEIRPGVTPNAMFARGKAAGKLIADDARARTAARTAQSTLAKTVADYSAAVERGDANVNTLAGNVDMLTAKVNDALAEVDRAERELQARQGLRAASGRLASAEEPGALVGEPPPFRTADITRPGEAPSGVDFDHIGATWRDNERTAAARAQFDALPDDAVVTVYHGTTPENAAAILESRRVDTSASGGNKPLPTIATDHMYVAPTAADAARYGDAVVRFDVTKGELAKSPEAIRADPAGKGTVTTAFFNTFDGAVLPPGQAFTRIEQVGGTGPPAVPVETMTIPPSPVSLRTAATPAMEREIGAAGERVKQTKVSLAEAKRAAGRGETELTNAAAEAYGPAPRSVTATLNRAEQGATLADEAALRATERRQAGEGVLRPTQPSPTRIKWEGSEFPAAQYDDAALEQELANRRSLPPSKKPDQAAQDRQRLEFVERVVAERKQAGTWAPERFEPTRLAETGALSHAQRLGRLNERARASAAIERATRRAIDNANAKIAAIPETLREAFPERLVKLNDRFVNAARGAARRIERAGTAAPGISAELNNAIDEILAEHGDTPGARLVIPRMIREVFDSVEGMPDDVRSQLDARLQAWESARASMMKNVGDIQFQGSPAPFRGPVTTSRLGFKSLMAQADEMAARGDHASAQILRTYAEDIPSTVEAMDKAGIKPTFLTGGEAGNVPKPSESLSLTPKKLAAQYKRGPGFGAAQLDDVTRRQMQQAKLIIQNQTKVDLTNHFGRNAGEFVEDPSVLSREELDRAVRAKGYVPLKGEIYGPETKVVPEFVAQESSKYDKQMTDSVFYNLLNGVNSKWKTGILALSPRWHMGNIVGNAMMAMVYGGVGPGELVQHLNRIRKEGGGLKALYEAGGAVEGRPAELLNQGVTRFEHELSRKRGPGPVKEPGPIGKLAEHSYRANEFADAMFRTAVYDAKLGRGIPSEAALKQTMNAMGNFSRMTHFERTWVRQFLPFYPWLRHQTQAILRLPLEHPVRAAWMGHLANMYTDPSMTPQDLRLLGLRTPQSWGPLGGVNLSTINPFADPTRMPLVDPSSIGQSLSPVLKLPAAVAGLDIAKQPPGQFTRPGGKTGFLTPKELAYYVSQQVPFLNTGVNVALDPRISRYKTGEPVPSQTGVPTGRNRLSVLMQGLGIPWPDQSITPEKLAAQKARTGG